MKTNLHIGGMIYYPLRLLSDNQMVSFKSHLTYVSPFADDDGKRKTIELFSTKKEGYIGLPIDWVKNNLPEVYKLALEDDRRTTTGTINYRRLPDPYHPNVRDPETQKKFMEDLLEAAKQSDSVFGVMGTGGGKTASSLKVACELGYRTLVCVDKNDLKLQWISQITTLLGIPEEEIGIIQQDKCEFEGKSVVIMMLPSEARNKGTKYPEEIYDAFGTIIIDEASVLATEFFGTILPRFNAKYRIAIDATPRRKDGSDIAVTYHIGQPSAIADSLKMPVKIYPVKYYSKRKLWGKNDDERMLCLARDPDRNQLIVDYIKALYQANRQVLIVSDKIAQLETLIRMCEEQGIAKDAMGQYTAQRQKYDVTHTWKVVGKRNTTPAEREEAQKKQLIFATIQLVKRAWDVPRLDAGIEALPMWQGAQLVGRIRRYLPSKKFPKWITIRDMKCPYSEKRYKNRVNEWNECGAEIVGS